jgi:hypothetical protein
MPDGLRAETIEAGKLRKGIGALKPQGGRKTAWMAAMTALMKIFDRDCIE